MQVWRNVFFIKWHLGKMRQVETKTTFNFCTPWRNQCRGRGVYLYDLVISHWKEEIPNKTNPRVVHRQPKPRNTRKTRLQQKFWSDKLTVENTAVPTSSGWGCFSWITMRKRFIQYSSFKYSCGKQKKLGRNNFSISYYGVGCSGTKDWKWILYNIILPFPFTSISVYATTHKLHCIRICKWKLSSAETRWIRACPNKMDFLVILSPYSYMYGT